MPRLRNPPNSSRCRPNVDEDPRLLPTGSAQGRIDLRCPFLASRRDQLPPGPSPHWAALARARLPRATEFAFGAGYVARHQSHEALMRTCFAAVALRLL